MAGVVLKIVLTKLTHILEQEVSLISSVKDEIKSLRDELALLTIFLRGLDEQSERTDLAQELVDQLNEVSYRAEDVVDVYLSRFYETGRLGEVEKGITRFWKLSWKRKLAKETKRIKEKIREIHVNKERYGIKLDASEPSKPIQQQHVEDDLNRRRKIVEEGDDVVGFGQQSEEVIKMILPKEGGEESCKQLQVVSIIGMGGLGKTTLAKKIFNSQKVKDHFHTRVWMVVSEDYQIKDLFNFMLQSLKIKPLEHDDETSLKERLRKQLMQNCYMIVLDDVWNYKLWDELKAAYLPPDQMDGSRVLLTSRIENVANAASKSSTIYHLKPLGEKESWDLFCKKALKGEACPTILEDTGKRIVSKCKGLPLAIVVLGGFLCAAEPTPSIQYWSKILHDTSWHPDDNNDCSKILLLSYRYLPRHLKPCFLYVGVFREDSEILAKRICLLWVVEGFVEPKRGRMLEDEAKQYLVELVDRNLLIVSKRCSSDGGIKVCRIHDLFRDLCVLEAQKLSLYEVEIGGRVPKYSEGTRRLVLHTGPSNVRSSVQHPLPKQLRSILDLSGTNASLLAPLGIKSTSMRVLHVEDLEENRNFEFAELRLLRYLRLRCRICVCDLIKVPSISKICNLQVLDLDGIDGVQMPVGIWNLRQLRYVSIKTNAILPNPPSSDHTLVHLQKLSVITIEEHTSSLITKGMFPNLKRLSLHNGYSWVPDSLYLTLTLTSLDKLLQLEAVNICIMVNNWSLAFPKTLTKLTLEARVISPDTWELLGKLQNLLILKLDVERNCDLTCKADGFPQLHYFKVSGNLMSKLTIEEGAFKSLQYLITARDSVLKQLPKQLWLLPALLQVKVLGPSPALKQHIDELDDSKKSKICTD